MPIWNTAFNGSPIGSDLLSDIDTTIQNFKQAVYERVSKEHVMDLNDGYPTTDGYHRAGSAKVYYQGSAPTNKPDGVALSTNDAGRLYINSSTKRIAVWDGSAWRDTEVKDAQFAKSLYPVIENVSASVTLGTDTRVVQYAPPYSGSPPGNTILLTIPANLPIGTEMTFIKTTSNPCVCRVTALNGFIDGASTVTICYGSTRRYDVCMIRKLDATNWIICEGVRHSETTTECYSVIGNSFRITVSTSAPSGGNNGDVWIQVS